MKSLKPKEEVKIKHNILIKMLDEKKGKLHLNLSHETMISKLSTHQGGTLLILPRSILFK